MDSSYYSQDNPLFGNIFSGRLRKKEQKKLEMAEHIARSIASEGLEKLSYTEVGKAFSMTRQHVLYYFSSKSEMIEAAVRVASIAGQKITIEALKNKGKKSTLTVLIEAPFEWAMLHPEYLRVFNLFYYLSSFDENYKRLQSQLSGLATARMKAAIQEEEVVASLGDRRLNALAATVHSVVSGRLLYAAGQPKLKLSRAYVRETVELIEGLLRLAGEERDEP